MPEEEAKNGSFSPQYPTMDDLIGPKADRKKYEVFIPNPEDTGTLDITSSKPPSIATAY
jgi:hypothetical protein